MRFALACLALCVSTVPVSAQVTAANAAAADSKALIYELRTYYPAPGKLAALNARFREHTLGLFKKHGMRSPEGRVIYVLAYPSRAARDASWKAFTEDPEWRTVAAASEVGGKLVTKVDSVFMTMTDYSPPLPLAR
jgi:hypothetical protein